MIEEVGRLEARRSLEKGARIRVRSGSLWRDLEIGDSICVNGVCLTVVEKLREGFEADVSEESLNRTTLGDLRLGSRVNLERALTLASRLGGHLVLGHVDGIGRIAGIERKGDGVIFEFSCPAELEHYLVEKGSIAVDGISLTISSLVESGFSVAVIPHTLRETNISGLRVGEAVNLETDIIGKYVLRFLEKERAMKGTAARSGESLYEKLVEGGFI